MLIPRLISFPSVEYSAVLLVWNRFCSCPVMSHFRLSGCLHLVTLSWLRWEGQAGRVRAGLGAGPASLCHLLAGGSAHGMSGLVSVLFQKSLKSPRDSTSPVFV